MFIFEQGKWGGGVRVAALKESIYLTFKFKHRTVRGRIRRKYRNNELKIKENLILQDLIAIKDLIIPKF